MDELVAGEFHRSVMTRVTPDRGSVAFSGLCSSVAALPRSVVCWSPGVQSGLIRRSGTAGVAPYRYVSHRTLSTEIIRRGRSLNMIFGFRLVLSGISQKRALCGLRFRQSTVTAITVVSRVSLSSLSAESG